MVANSQVITGRSTKWRDHGGIRGVWRKRAAVPLFAAGALAAIALCMLAAAHPTFPGDRTLMAAVQGIESVAWRVTMFTVTDIGGGWVALAAAGLLTAVLFKLRRYPESLSFLLVFSLTVIVPLVKELVYRPRPSEAVATILSHSGGTSFPSGHSALAMVFFGLVFYLAPYLVQDRRVIWAVRSVSVAMVLLTGLSRVYLGVHWPSDVIGGYAVGGVVLGMITIFHRWASEVRQQASIDIP